MSNFLRQTGYLVVKKAFDPALVARLSSELDRVRDEAVEGELTSWWADDGRGGRFPYRLTYLSEKSPDFAALYENPRVIELRELSREKIVPMGDRIEGILAVLKEFTPGAEVSAFANLPFHNDCGFGGCHITCPCVLVGVWLDASNPGSSQLHMMAGSWGKAFHPFPDEAMRRCISDVDATRGRSRRRSWRRSGSRPVRTARPRVRGGEPFEGSAARLRREQQSIPVLHERDLDVVRVADPARDRRMAFRRPEESERQLVQVDGASSMSTRIRPRRLSSKGSSESLPRYLDPSQAPAIATASMPA